MKKHLKSSKDYFVYIILSQNWNIAGKVEVTPKKLNIIAASSSYRRFVLILKAARCESQIEFSALPPL